ncbi:MAG: exodeoxyribonuclease I [Gammaproteobacteria bacterium]|nr:exodeoxyribonuclease I [Gammaproteobacteria bacterium]
MDLTFYWHDYETWGTSPSRDWPSQFAGVRTDATLKVIGKPLSMYCYPADDLLPQPEACLVTGITPQRARKDGVIEAEFFRRIHQELARSGTCGVGYNSLRFDDEVTRYGLYRNFFDPYAREWQNGNSRWDIIDMIRLAHALRPEGIVWPSHEDGTPSFRLEQLTVANGISHQGAHDALSDVYATIELAKLIKLRQPKLFDYLFRMRGKQEVAKLLNLPAMQPVLHVSSMYPASQGCIAMVVPLARHPVNKNGIIVYDLSQDPASLLQLSAEEISIRLFTPRSELPMGVERIPLKTIHLNKCPVVVPTSTLNDASAQRWAIDIAAGEAHLKRLKSASGLAQKIQKVHLGSVFEPVSNPDLNLYGGGFFSSDDRRKMDEIRQLPPDSLRRLNLQFDDLRLPEMLFRYRARNWPGALSSSERRRWEEFRVDRINNPEGGGGITLAEYQSKLARMMVDSETDSRERKILSELADWPESIGVN